MTSPALSFAAPIDNSDRIASLDAVRGFALLGILLMNIVGFALYFGAYEDPTVAGGGSGINLWTWYAMRVFADGKMRCIFSMAFGASMLLLTSRLEERGAPAADIYYRRLLWLMLFGIVHVYLLWLGDILYWYALLGLVLYPFRRMRARSLLVIGATLVVLQAGVSLFKGHAIRETIRLSAEASKLEKEGKALSDEQKDAKREWEQMRTMFRPTADELRKDAEKWRGNLLSVLKTRAGIVTSFLHPQVYYGPFSWDVWSMMFIGMGLFKLGVFSGARSTREYVWMAAAGYGVGVPLNGLAAWFVMRSGFDVATRFSWAAAYDVGRFSVALAHVSVLVLLCRSAAMRRLVLPLEAVGRTAFSNYVLQSVICSTLFTGFGFGLYGKLERHQLYIVVAAVWAFQLIASPLWLARYGMGPLEWCWRALTYRKRPTMRIRPVEAVLPAEAV